MSAAHIDSNVRFWNVCREAFHCISSKLLKRLMLLLNHCALQSFFPRFFFFLSFLLLNLGYLTEVTFPWLPDLPWTWVHFSAVAQMFYKLPPVASEWRTSQFPAPAARVARGPVWMCTLYLNPCFSSHAEILQGLICCCLSSLDVSWPTLY